MLTMDQWVSGMEMRNPASSAEMQRDWVRAKSEGAIGGYVVVYTDSAMSCVQEASGLADVVSTYPVVQSVVIQFKDEASAARIYNGGGFIQTDPGALKNEGAIAGTATGLGTNSVCLMGPPLYMAYWQHRSYIARLIVVNVDANVANDIAAKVNGRMV